MDDCKFRMVEMMHLYLSGAITDEEMQELQKWLDAAPENRAMFDRVCKGKDILYKYRMYKKIDHRAAYGRCEKRARRTQTHSSSEAVSTSSRLG